MHNILTAHFYFCPAYSCSLADRHLPITMAILARLRSWIQRSERWYLTTPDRALDEAYDAALAIRAIEEQHFKGEKIEVRAGGYSASSVSYFEAELRKNLKIIRMRLTEFRASRTTVDITNPSASLYQNLELAEDSYTPPVNGRYLPPVADRVAITLEKLKFIDDVQLRYEPQRIRPTKPALIPVAPNPTANNLAQGAATPKNLLERQTQIAAKASKKKSSDLESITDKTGVLPRSILGTINRLQRDLNPRSAVEAAQNQRLNYAKTFISVRFVLLLVSLTLLSQLSMRYLILDNQLPTGRWLSAQFATEDADKLFLNTELEERAFQEMSRYEEKLKFRNRLKEATGQAPMTPAAIDLALKTRVTELATQSSDESANAIKNWIADLTGLLVFCVILVNSSREVEILKAFLNETVYGLSDSAKAFVIILLTDIFVGFHSPHGWEVLLEGISNHLGLPTSRNFIFLFIATFPVILDTIFKYWIFRYLNRVSPSAVATYKEMNE
jgi:CemA family